MAQATLGIGPNKERSVVQCSVGGDSPIFLCSLSRGKVESCPLNLELEGDESVAFSVIGPQSIYLSGYFRADSKDDDAEFYDMYPSELSLLIKSLFFIYFCMEFCGFSFRMECVIMEMKKILVLLEYCVLGVCLFVIPCFP